MANPDRAVWLDVLSYLRRAHPHACRQWFDDLEAVGIAGGVFKLRVSQHVHLRYLKKACTELFRDAIQSVTGQLLSVSFVGPDEEVAAPTPVNGHSNGVAAHTRSANHISPGDYHHDSLVISPDYTFDTFVVGQENRVAHAGALAVANSPGQFYNPLFIHGGVGLGKTHLLQAICLHILKHRPSARILYVSCEGFITQFTDAVQAGQMNDFRHRFRDVDVLVVDDIHFLAKMDKTQEEFFHTFNSLQQAGKQIILSSDAAPSDIPALEQRLVSRFKSGMVGEVQMPGYETRIQILKQKARIRGLEMPEEVVAFIANRISANIRELEGAIVRIQMQSIADTRPISLDLARLALDGMATPSAKAEITIHAIINSVVDYYGVKTTDLQSKRRQKSIAHPRQVCMYLARKYTRFSLEEIGGFFGGRDHTTVMHAVKAVDERRQGDDSLNTALSVIEQQIRPGSSATSAGSPIVISHSISVGHPPTMLPN